MNFYNGIVLRIIVIFSVAISASIIWSVCFVNGMPQWNMRSSVRAVYDEEGKRIDVDLKSAKEFYFNNSAAFIDARNPDLFNKGHIAKALNVPWSNVENRVSVVLEMLKPETTIIIYCDGISCNLSQNLALFLIELGYKDVRVLVNGWTEWKKAGLPVEPDQVQ